MWIPTPFLTVASRTILFLLLIQLNINAQIFANQTGKQKITITVKDRSLEQVFRLIEKQTNLRFVYAVEDLRIQKQVNVNFNQALLEDVLANLLSPQGITWQFREGSILLKSSRKRPEEKNELNTEVTVDKLQGRILNNNGEPIPGATILIKGTTKGTQSSSDGSFILSDVTPGMIIIITSIGFETRELTLQNLNNITINLKNAVGELEEVVIAYGKALKKNINGNISSIKAEDIEKSPVTNPLLVIQGRVPGIEITQVNGINGGGVTTLIQGQNSINKGNDPFYVIDGVPYTSTMLPSLGGILGQSGVNMQSLGSPLNYINPSDIESISVLKDADATAIYGSRAANGAILITTKKGKAGKTKIGIDLQQGWSKAARYMDMLNTKQYMEMRREAIKNDKTNISEYDYDINGFWDTIRNTNWQKELISNTAKYSNINANISGGTNYVQYMVGGTFHRETTVFPGNFNDQKAAFHFSLNSNSENNRFQMQLTGNYMIDHNRLPTIDLTNIAIGLAPVVPKLYNDDGSVNFMPDASGRTTFYNPIILLNNKYNNKTYNLVSNLTLSYNLLPGLNIRSSFGYTDLRVNEAEYHPITSYYPEELQNSQRFSLLGNSDNNSWIIEPQISYEKFVGKGKFEGLLGTSIQHREGSGYQIRTVGYSSDEDMTNINASTDIFPYGVSEFKYKYAGFFGRLNYNLLNKYSINLSARRDGSSRFGSANRYNSFGAIGIGWTFSDEDFFKYKLPFINYGKLRASYGTTGNDQIGDYLYLSLYNPINVDIPYGGITGFSSNGIPNPYLQWESTRKMNIGVDVNLFNDRSLLVINYFRNRSSNQLVGTQLPAMAGGVVLTLNYQATVQNTGWEFSWDNKLIKSPNFQWSVNVNLTIPRNKLIKYDNLENTNDKYRLIVGRSLNISQLYHSLGVDKETGVYQFADSKGNPTTNPSYTNDRTILKDLSRLYYGGLSTNLSYKSFSIDVLFNVVKQNARSNFTGIGVPPGTYPTNQPTYVLDRWKSPTEGGSHQRFNSDFSLFGSYLNANDSDLSVTDASYLRLKNISISWKMPDHLTKKINFSLVRIYAQAQNLFTLTNYKGLDPETLSTTTLPPLRTIVVGLKLGL